MRITTRITDQLDADGVRYRVLYHREPVYTMEAAAAQRGVVPEEMVKSILLREASGRRYVMACTLGNDRLDPKAVRAYLGPGWRRLSFATAEEILEVTGFVMGAVAPLALPEELPVVFDEAIAAVDKVNISSGDVMAGLELATEDLIRLSHGQLASIAQDDPS